ncbi:MAG TPA: hypothetical protein VM753_13945 [Anaeromyxobacter sp.]|jgi:hypothetical protein|nr:hypothetical protein [Anaeromyxobacter sp.]
MEVDDGSAMVAHRETFYRCTFSTPEIRRVAHVSAWDEEEAVELFEAELIGDGVEEPGTIEVASLTGVRSRRAEYRPARAAAN